MENFDLESCLPLNVLFVKSRFETENQENFGYTKHTTVNTK